ncbi:MAG: acetyltransferase [Cytophagaceae bacterium]|nr:acetyltransferase [Cytophagaceae bacterium]
MKKIVIIGAGGFGREVLSLIEAINRLEEQYAFFGFIDDGIASGEMINGFPVLGGIDYLSKQNEEINVVVAIGNPLTKKSIIEKLIKNKFILFPNIIHPLVFLNNYGNKFGVGNIICEGNIITTNVQFGNFIILNLACTVGHDTVIEDFCSIMPGVNISGEVNLKKSVYIGTGAKIINQLEIGENTIVGAGAVVYKSLPPNCTAVGLPAKPIKFHEK